MDRMVGGIIRFMVGLFSSFFFLFLLHLRLPLIHTNLRLAMAMATTSKSLLFSFLVFFSCFYIYFLPFFVAFSSNPFFLLLQRTPDTKSLRPMAAPSAGAVS